MTSTKTKFSVGLFVVIGIAIAVVAILWLGMSHYFEKGRYYATYFDESVQGLDIDSPVKYRGVSIGRVEKFGLAPDVKLIEVILKIESDFTHSNDIVAQLKSVGITGIMFVELDRKKAGEPNLSPTINFSSSYPVIETRPSDIKQFIKGVDEIMNRLNKLDILNISESFQKSLDIISSTVNQIQTKEISSEIIDILNKINRIINTEKITNIINSIETLSNNLNQLSKTSTNTVAKINHVINSNEKDIAQIVNNLKVLVEKMDKTIESGSFLIQNTDNNISTLIYHLTNAAQNIEKAGANLDSFIELLANKPSHLIFGSSPQPKKIEPSYKDTD